MTGTLYGLGVGPGDPELITVKALRLLRHCPVIAYPAADEGDSLARAIVAPYLVPGTTPPPQEIVLRLPMRTDREAARAGYDRGAADIAAHLDQGRDVAALCEGDPLFFGSFMYLFDRLAGRYRVEIVPGVSSLGAAAASAGLPLVERNQVLSVIPAPLPAPDLEARLRRGDACAIVKLGRHFTKVRAVLGDLGLLDHARYVERATMDRQRVLPVRAVDPGTVPYFSLILVAARGAQALPEVS
ncbi:MAG: precorrin-2 C(20)-methyltransferase [Azospirillaceae bacterium]|nr:precorrin-2 C(20)-methyltransferase [Azospirillaceae bacterium]